MRCRREDLTKRTTSSASGANDERCGRWEAPQQSGKIVIAVPVARRRGLLVRQPSHQRNPFLVKSDHDFLASSENAVTSHLPSMKKPQHVLQP